LSERSETVPKAFPNRSESGTGFLACSTRVEYDCGVSNRLSGLFHKGSIFEMVEMDKSVSGKRGWVTRASTEYAFWGDRE